MEDVLYQHGAATPPNKKKHYVFEANAIETSDTVVLLSCSHFFFLLQPTHLSASCPETPKPQIPTPSSPWSPYVHPSGIPIKIPFLFITKEPSEPPGCRKKWQIVKGLLIGSLLGRLPFANFLAIPGGVPRMLWNDPIYTVWQEKWPANPFHQENIMGT